LPIQPVEQPKEHTVPTKTYQPVSDKTYQLPAPIGTLPQLMDAERINDPAHVRQVAIEILRRAGETVGAHTSIDMSLWMGLLREQCMLALDLNPFMGNHQFADQWDYVLCGLVDAHRVSFDLATRLVTASELDMWLLDTNGY
jgi:hypothetical protein